MLPAKATARRIGRGVGLEGVLGLAALGQAVPAADELGGVVELELAVVVGQLLLEGPGDGLLVDGEHEHLVVGEQVALDGLAEAEPVELRAVELLVVHRREDGVGLAGLGLGGVVVDPRRRGHVEPLGGRQVVVVVDRHERRLVLAGEGRRRWCGGPRRR